MITRTMRRERPSLFSPPPNKQQQQNNNEEEGETSSQTSPYSLSNEDMNQLTDEFDNNTNSCEELTTSGRTYEELVKSQQKQNNNNQRDSLMSEETEESNDQHEQSSRNYGRQSVGFMLGRNSLSNWSTIGGNNNGGLINYDNNEDSNYNNNNIPTSVQLNESQLNTGRKSNVSRHSLGGGRRSSLGSFNIDTPKDATNNNNVSQRVGSRKNTTGQVGQARLSRPSNNNGGGRRSQNQLNVSHISSSSSSGLNTTGESGMLGDSWSPIRTSLENSFVKNVANNQQQQKNSMIGNGGENDVSTASIGVKRSGSLSPIRGRSSNNSLSPNRSPVRSPLGDISPNRSPSRGNQSPKKMGVSSPKQQQQQRRATTANTTNMQKKALSPNGTYSLKEAEGKRLSLPITSNTGNSSSSNMSMSSGSASGSTSSKTLTTTQSASKTIKLALPSLGSSRKQQLPKKVVTNKAPTTLSQDSDMTMLSPEKPKGDNVRSQQPAPTPNSQRRVIKRFRASVPTANYLLPEDVMDDDSLEKNPVVSRKETEKSISKSTRQSNARKSSSGPQFLMEMEDATESTYENTFEFPSDSIPLPRTKTLGHFHDQAVAVGSPSHQYQLNRAGTNLLSLQEVILPSIAYETNVVLKEKQAKAQRYAQDGKPDSQGTEVIKAIETCRRVVTKCTGEAMKVAGEAWRTREAEREQLRVQRLKQETAQQKAVDAKAKKDRKEARANSRHERYERQKREKKHNHPRNKELWQEVTKLMVEIQKLEKEERLWKDTLVEVNHLVENHQPPEMHDLDSVVPMKESELVNAVEGATLESTTNTLVGDVTLATERINWMLKSVSLAIEESDKLRKEAFDHYQDEHKFVGYPKIDDSKGLFMALSMESPAR